MNMRKMRLTANGFSLLELTVVIAILGILAAVAVPSVTLTVKKGRPKALESDGNVLQLAVDQFHFDEHRGPDASQMWGIEVAARLYPTEDGLVGDLELNPDQSDPENPDNPRIDRFLLGAGTNGPATDDDIENSLVWLGLLVNDPFGAVAGTENRTTGLAHPLLGETGLYLQEFTKSATEDNSDRDLDHTNGNGITKGSYRWVLLQDTRVFPAYKSGTVWFAGPNGSLYP